MNEYSTLLHNVRHPKCHCIHIHPSPSITSGAKHPVFPYTSNPYFPHGGENDDHHQLSHIITYLTQNIHIFANPHSTPSRQPKSIHTICISTGNIQIQRKMCPPGVMQFCFTSTGMIIITFLYDMMYVGDRPQNHVIASLIIKLRPLCPHSVLISNRQFKFGYNQTLTRLI